MYALFENHAFPHSVQKVLGARGLTCTGQIVSAAKRETYRHRRTDTVRSTLIAGCRTLSQQLQFVTAQSSLLISHCRQQRAHAGGELQPLQGVRLVRNGFDAPGNGRERARAAKLRKTDVETESTNSGEGSVLSNRSSTPDDLNGRGIFATPLDEQPPKQLRRRVSGDRTSRVFFWLLWLLRFKLCVHGLHGRCG